MAALQLFDSSYPKKIIIKFKELADISDFKSSIKSKILEIKDITNSEKIIIIDFDLEGRIMNIRLGNESSKGEVKIFERGFDGRFYVYLDNCKNLNPDNKNIYRYYDYYNETVGENLKVSEFLINSVNVLLKEVFNIKYKPSDRIVLAENRSRESKVKLNHKLGMIERAYKLYNWNGLLKEKSTIQKIYCKSISVLPPEVRPDQNPVFSIVQIVQGCWIKDKKGPCKFCNSYQCINYREKSIGELKEHIDKVRNNAGKGWKYVKKIFLLDADPLHTDMKSETYLRFLRKEISSVKWYESFISTSAILSKSINEWRKIMKLGLKKVYWGVESADDSILILLGKPHTNKILYKAASILNKIGIHYVVVLLSGVANLNYKNNHIEETSKFIRDIKATDVYISRLTPQPNTEIFSLIKNKKLIFSSPSEREAEHRKMIKMISCDKENRFIADRSVRGTYGVQFNR